jgi:hypothetical protein
MSGPDGKLPPPKLLLEQEPDHLPKPRSPSLEELLEEASRVQALAFGAGTLIGECLDTHNPHLRVRGRARAGHASVVAATLTLQEREASRLLAVQSAIDEGDSSGLADGDSFARVRAQLGLTSR